jgi:aarF domain-containing kinase
VDFGATLEYTREFRNGYAGLLRDLRHENADHIFKSAVKFGLLDPRESEEARQAFKTMIEVSLEPFDSRRQPFDFTNRDFEKRTRDANIAFSRTLVYSPPPRQLLFLHRKLGGIFNLVKKMKVNLDLRSYWELMTADIPEGF